MRVEVEVIDDVLGKLGTRAVLETDHLTHVTLWDCSHTQCARVAFVGGQTLSVPLEDGERVREAWCRSTFTQALERHAGASLDEVRRAPEVQGP